MLARKRSITVSGHRTSFSLEDIFFDDLCVLAKQTNLSVAMLVTKIDAQRPRNSNLSSAIRLYILAEAKAGNLKES
ncbi:MAG: ribbon-helix-helix domain-containing protein [Ahrensia sp.]|nr:ribbon-helix-helix domain-containing protein [Ahrensia sp.]